MPNSNFAISSPPNIPQTTNKKKAHAASMSLLEYVNSFNPATKQDLKNNIPLLTFFELENSSVMPNGQHKLLSINEPIIIENDDGKGKEIDATGTIGLVLRNNNNIPVSLACISPDGSQSAIITDKSQPCAYVIGDLGDRNKAIVAIDNLDDAATIANWWASDVTMLISLDKYMFYNMVRDFGKIAPITVFADEATKNEVCSKLAGANAKAVITPLAVVNYVEHDLAPYADILAHKETKIIEMSAWKPLGDISDPESKATRYPIEAWGAKGSILREAVEAIAYHAQAPDAIAGQCMLGNLATILQQYINAPYALNRRFMPVSLFLLTEADSGGGKSRTVGLSHKMLTEFQKQKRKEDKQLESEWKAQKAITPRKELERWLLDNPPPKKTIIFAKNGTIQGFLDNMLLGNTANVAWATAEAAMFLGGHSLTSETASSNIAQICDIWSGGEFDRLLSPRYDTINETGISGVRFTLDLQGQPAIIEPALNNELMNGQGLLPRFLFAFPDNMNGKIVYNTPERMDADPDSDPRLITYWRRCQALLEPCQPKLNDDGSVKRFNMPFANRAARQALADYQTKCEAQLIKGGRLEKYASYAKRLHENASRIAAIMAYFDGRSSISADDIHRATTLTDYSMTERMRYTDKPQSGDNNTQKLLNWLIKYCRKESVTHIAYATAQSKATPKTLRAKHTFDLLIEVLENEHYLKVIQDGRARHIELRPELLGG